MPGKYCCSYFCDRDLFALLTVLNERLNQFPVLTVSLLVHSHPVTRELTEKTKKKPQRETCLSPNARQRRNQSRVWSVPFQRTFSGPLTTCLATKTSSEQLASFLFIFRSKYPSKLCLSDAEVSKLPFVAAKTAITQLFFFIKFKLLP